MIAPTRRSFLTTCLALAAAPAIIRASSLMPVKSAAVDPIWMWTAKEQARVAAMINAERVFHFDHVQWYEMEMGRMVTTEEAGVVKQLGRITYSIVGSQPLEATT